MKVLHVAEKNDAAKNIATILSNGTHRVRDGLCRFNKIYEFTAANFKGASNVQMCMTSVSGHVLNFQFPENYKNWNSVDPLILFDAPVIKKCETDTAEQIKRTLEREVRGCNQLVIWTDNDREGEAIGFEIIEICKAVKSNLKVWRAKFSEITRPSILRSLSQLEEPNEYLKNAVQVRSELDLRIGAAFTRLQTLLVGRKFSGTQANVLSYGSCQFPTLGFVVERYKEIESFRPENFYTIKVTHEKESVCADFAWKRGRIFDELVCLILYEKMTERPTMTIQSVKSKPKSKFRPQPMDTVTLEKLASRKLRMTAKEALGHAEKLYTEGLISYPRTETTKFPPELALRPLVESQLQSQHWGPFAQRILNEWNGPNPRNGQKTDQAHPPIHPTKFAQLNLQDNKGKVYELVVRHFLACVSEDAKGFETIVSATIDEEHFSVSGLQILQRNYLDVYPYEKWNAKVIPNYTENETFIPTSINLSESQTSAPDLLTEADLIALMEKHGIGTDATHADHIDKVKEREYIGMADQMHFLPGQIGMGLVEGYDNMGFEMSKPHLRASLERDLVEICERRKDHQQVLRAQIEAYRRVFINSMRQINCLNVAMGKYLQEQPLQNAVSSIPSDVAKCPRCQQGKMILRNNRAGNKWFLTCNAACQAIMWLPSSSLSGCSVSSEECEFCVQIQKLTFNFMEGKYTHLPRTYQLCVFCDEVAINLFNLRVVQGTPMAQNNSNATTNARTSSDSNRNVQNSSRGGASGRTRNCGACGRPGHRRTTCPNTNN